MSVPTPSILPRSAMRAPYHRYYRQQSGGYCEGSESFQRCYFRYHQSWYFEGDLFCSKGQRLGQVARPQANCFPLLAHWRSIPALSMYHALSPGSCLWEILVTREEDEVSCRIFFLGPIDELFQSLPRRKSRSSNYTIITVNWSSLIYDVKAEEVRVHKPVDEQ